MLENYKKIIISSGTNALALSQKSVNYGRKRFYRIGHRSLKQVGKKNDFNMTLDGLFSNSSGLILLILQRSLHI